MAPGSPPSRWFADPPPADGAKVVISDTDHYAPGQGDALWAWKSFLRGHHPILMDFGLIGGLDPPGAEATEPGVAVRGLRAGAVRDGRHPPLRRAGGPDRRWSRAATSLDGLRAGDPGREYLVLEPAGDGEPFTVALEPGPYEVEWFGVTSRRTDSAEAVTVDQTGSIDFTAPFDDGPAVLYLRRSEARGTTAG